VTAPTPVPPSSVPDPVREAREQYDRVSAAVNAGRFNGEQEMNDLMRERNQAFTALVSAVESRVRLERDAELREQVEALRRVSGSVTVDNVPRAAKLALFRAPPEVTDGKL
jgi:hypothetical protein